MARRLLVVLGFAALIAASALMLLPVHANVSTSALPDVIRSIGRVDLGKGGLSVDLSGPETSVNCGPAMAPYVITVEPSNVLQKLLDGARQVEGRITDACSTQVDHRRLLAAATGGGALLLFALGIAARPARAGRTAAPPAPVIPHSWPQATEAWSAPVSPRGAPEPSSWPPPPTTSPTPPVPAPRSGRPRRRGLVPAAVLGAVVAVAVVGWTVARSGADASSSERTLPAAKTTSTTEDPRLELARNCMTTTLDSADRHFETARARSTADEANSKLNLDGDRSFRDYAAGLDALDLTNCPNDFRATFLQYASTWRDYGAKHLGATKGPFPDTFSDVEHQRLTTRINQVRALLETIARDAGCTVVSQTFHV